MADEKKFIGESRLREILTNIKSKLDGKSDTSHTHTASEVGALPSSTTYAGSSTAGGAATSAITSRDATWFGTCATGRNLNSKLVVCENFELETGSRIAVRFTNTGTENPTSGNFSLNVNSTGSKLIITAQTNRVVLTYAFGEWFCNNMVHEFVYDGTYWVWTTKDTKESKYIKCDSAVYGDGSATTLVQTALTNLASGVSGNRAEIGIINQYTIPTLEQTDENIMGCSDAYSDTKTYAVGECCIYLNALYKCIVACTGEDPYIIDSVSTSGSTGHVNSTYWKQITLTQMLSDFTAGVNTIYNSVVAKGYTPTSKTPSAISSTINNYLWKPYIIGCRNVATNTTSQSWTDITSGVSADSRYFSVSSGVYTCVRACTVSIYCYVRAYTLWSSTDLTGSASARVLVNGSSKGTIKASGNSSNNATYTVSLNVGNTIKFQHIASSTGVPWVEWRILLS